MENSKKFYTFLNVTDGPENIKNVTTAVTLVKPEIRATPGGKRVLTCAAAISNRTKTLNTVLGTNIEDKDGTVWVDVQFWDERADRFQKFIGDKDKVRIVVCGRLSVHKWTSKDGKEMQRIQISANDWMALPQSSAAPAETAPAAPVNAEESGCEDLPF